MPARAWVASDVFGDQDSFIVGFTEPDGGEHAILGLVDHNLSGQAKDAWIAADVDEVVAAWASTGDEHMRIHEVPVDSMLGRLREAMAAAEVLRRRLDGRCAAFVRTIPPTSSSSTTCDKTSLT